MKRLAIFSLFGLIISCSKTSESDNRVDSGLFSQPSIFPLQLTNHYKNNVTNGDPVGLIINFNGDTINPGIPCKIDGKIISTSDILPPVKIKIDHLLKKSTPSTNQNEIIGNPTQYTVEWIDRTKIKSNHSYTDYVLLNSKGKKVKTGTPLTINGREVKWKQEKPTAALPLMMTDKAFGNIQYLDVDQGLNSSYILSIMQDKKGNLWFGTYGGGVSFYNGTSFTHLTQKNGIPNDIVRAVFEDSKGNIWIGSTGNGLGKFDGNSFFHYTEDDGMANNDILSIFEDSFKNLWFGTNGGVTKYDGQYFTHYSIGEGLSNNSVVSIAEDKNGKMWFGTENGISVLDAEQWFEFVLPNETESKIVLSLKSTSDSSIWFTLAGAGIFKFNDTTLTNYTEENGLSSNYIWTIVEDTEGVLWIGTSAKGVDQFDGKKITNFSENEGLPNGNIKCIFEDNSDNLWFGTYGGGLYRYRRNSFYHLNDDDGLTNSIARSIMEDRFGNIWYGTSGGGLCRFDGNQYTYFDESSGLTNNIVKSLLETKDGAIWIGTDGGGAFHFDGVNLTNYTTENGMSNNRILSMLEDKEGHLWFCTNGGGVTKCEVDSSGLPISYTHFTEKEGLSNNVVVSIYQDNLNHFWLSTDGGGLNKFDGTFMTNYSDAVGLSHNNSLAFIQDDYTNFWVGSYGGGISIFDSVNILHITEKEGLSSNTVWSIKQVENDDLAVFWVSTEKGINLIEVETGGKKNPSVKDYQFKIYQFTKQDGLIGLDFYSNSVCVDSKNRILWGSGKGVEILNLNTFKISDIVPTPRLDFIEVNEEFIDYRNLTKGEIDFDKVEPFYNYPQQLTLPYNKNHLTFHFSAIDWAAPHKLNYQFRMVGLNDNWSNPNKKNEADFRSIPYGTYFFEVRACGESQIWSEAFSYQLTIKAPWWHTWWFRILVLVALLFFLYQIYRIRTAALIQRQKQLEKTVAERTDDLKKEKELVEEKHKEITDSINYAERIQRSFLATKNLLDKNLKNYFVFFQPKDVVSGDFYWATKLQNDHFALVTADSTGHGVPGAIMSILNITCLEKAVQEDKLVEPGEILNHARTNIIERLKKDGSADGGKDGMDASLVCFDFKNKKLSYAAANNPFWIVRKNEILEFAPDKMPVGKHDSQDIPFTSTQISLESGDVVYTLTDGFPDQFGGNKGKKFMYRNLKELLISIAHESMENQKQKLTQAFFEWKGDLEQVDDVCVIGVRI